MKICKNCRTKNKEDSSFCNNCGGSEFLHLCGSCGTEFEGNFCPNCGAQVELPDRWTLPPERSKRKVTFGRVLLWIFFLPIMGIIAIWQSRQMKTPWKIVLTGLIVLACVFYYRPKRNKTTGAQANARPTVTVTEKAPELKTTAVPATKKPTVTPKPTVKPTAKPTATHKPTEDPTPKEYRNALSKAQMYVNLMHMSKARLHDQLTSPYGEGFSEEAAQYALEHVKADWKENALKMAETYSSTMHMSKVRIYDQLTSE